MYITFNETKIFTIISFQKVPVSLLKEYYFTIKVKTSGQNSRISIFCELI